MSGSTIQEQIQQDWENREYIEVMTSSIKRLATFLNDFDIACKSRLANLDTKITNIEQKLEYIEARVTKGETLSWDNFHQAWLLYVDLRVAVK